MQKQKIFIISLGGSVFFPEDLDTEFIKKFRQFLLKRIKFGNKFILVVGGGFLARLYQNALSKVIKASSEDKDWVGIYATQANGLFWKKVFGKYACESFVINPEKRVKFDRPILIGAGYEPGWSTDMDAVLIAKTYKAKVILNLSNIKMLYNKDPKKYKTAKPILKISWKEYRKIVGNKWLPGMNTPFDPIAAKTAQELGLKVILLKGNDLDNLEKFFNGKDFIGSIIE